MSSYETLQSGNFTTFTKSEKFRENLRGEEVSLPPTPTQIRVNK